MVNTMIVIITLHEITLQCNNEEKKQQWWQTNNFRWIRVVKCPFILPKDEKKNIQFHSFRIDLDFIQPK